MSQVYVDTLKDREGTGSPTFPNGIQVTGVGTFSSQVSIAGTLTYEDVTQVDSVGIVTARLGLRATAGGLQVTSGITTLGGNLTVTGSATVAADGVLVGTGSSIFQPASNTLTLGTNSEERVRIDSSGRLLLGTTTEGEASADNLTVADSGDCGITIRGGTSSNCSILFSDGTSGTGEYAGNIDYDHNGDYMRFFTAAAEKARLTATGGVSLNNGELIERCNISSTALNSDTSINLDNGMVHYRTTAIGAASVKPNIYSSVGINTQMATGDIITVTIITACSSTSNFVDHIMVDYKDVTENWVGGSAPTAGGGSGVDTYAFNIIKTASETFTVIGNHVKTS